MTDAGRAALFAGPVVRHKAWSTEVEGGGTGTVYAATRSAARMDAARDIAETWGAKVGEALRLVTRVVRQPTADAIVPL